MKLKLSLYFIVVSLCLGCAVIPEGIDGQPLQRLTSLDKSQLFTGTSDGERVAYANNGLALMRSGRTMLLNLSKESPVKLSWSPSDETLAAVFKVADQECRLVQYSGEGELLMETVLPITISKLAWSVRGDLLVVGYTLNTFSFGGNLQQYLYLFNDSGIKKIKLDDVTLKPHTVKQLAANMSRVLPVHFTSYGDEFFYVRLHDPPEFPAYLKIVWKSWQAGVSKALMELPLQEIKFAPGARGDSAFVVLGDKKAELQVWQEPENVTAEAQALYGFADGRLFDGERLVADWGESSRMQILSGGNYLLALDNTLFLGSGLQPQATQSYSEKEWTLRRWRASGLISHQEYLNKLKDDQ